MKIETCYEVSALLEYESFRRVDDVERTQELIDRLFGAREVLEPLEADETETTEENT